MIIKIIQGRDFSGLAHYLTYARTREITALRGVSSAEAAAEEMSLVAGERPDVTVPAIHFIVTVAPEDWDRMSEELWIELRQDIVSEFGLNGHQMLEVQHPSAHERTKGPHRHVAFNKVHPLTFKLPDKGKKDRSSWDTAAVQRAWEVGDRFAERHGFRRVANPTKVEAIGRIENWKLKRELQDGIMPVAAQAECIRKVLVRPTWDARLSGLLSLGFTIELISEQGKGARSFLGARIVDLANCDNHEKVSAFGAQFGYAKLEKARALGSPELTAVLNSAEYKCSLKDRDRLPPPSRRDQYFAEFELHREAWRVQRASLKRKRRRLLREHACEKRELRAGLGKMRSAMLERAPKALHSAARAVFTAIRERPLMNKMRAHQKDVLAEVIGPSRPTWTAWLQAKALAGDVRAREIHEDMLTRCRGVTLKRAPVKNVDQAAAETQVIVAQCDRDGRAELLSPNTSEIEGKREQTRQSAQETSELEGSALQIVGSAEAATSPSPEPAQSPDTSNMQAEEAGYSVEEQLAYMAGRNGLGR